MRRRGEAFFASSESLQRPFNRLPKDEDEEDDDDDEEDMLEDDDDDDEEDEEVPLQMSPRKWSVV